MPDQALASIEGTIRSKPIRQTSVTLLSVSTTIELKSGKNTIWHKIIIPNDVINSMILHVDDRIKVQGSMRTRKIDSREIIEIRGVTLEVLTSSTAIH